MKRYVLIIILVLTCNNIYAQKIRFTDTSNKWLFYSSTEPGIWTTDTYYYTGHDTVVYGNTYHQMSSYQVSMAFAGGAGLYCGIPYVREDTLAGIVYALPDTNATGADTNGKVLYNYNWQVGDTIFTKSNWTADRPPHTAWIVIDSIGNILINSLSYKIWFFHLRDTTANACNTGHCYYNYLIEGLGCNVTLDYTLSPLCIFEIIGNLVCFKNQGQFPAVTVPTCFFGSDQSQYFDNTGGCDMAVDKETKNELSVRITPNPLTKDSKLILPNMMQEGSLKVYNMLGQEVMQMPIQNTNEISIKHNLWMSGIYTYTVSDANTGSVSYGKLIVE